MKLEKIEIENFGIFEHKVSIDIRESFSTIIGENGTGKSTILEAVNLLLDKKTRKKGVTSKVIYDETKQAKISYIFDVSQFKDISVFLPIDEDSKVLVEMTLDYDEEENVFLPTIFIGKIEKLEFKSYQTLPFDKFISVVYIKDAKDESTSEWIENEYRDTDALKDVNKEIDKANEEIAKIEPIQVFSEKVNNEVKKVFPEKGFGLRITSNVSTKRIGNAISFSAVNDKKVIKSHGSGFEKIFNIVSNINKSRDDNHLVIILIDELENNLFHSYQKQIVNYLKTLFDQKVTQILATTHSPNVVRIAPGSSIIKITHGLGVKTFDISETTHFDYYQKDLSTAVFFDYILVVEGHSEKMFYEYILKRNPVFSSNEKLSKLFILNNQGIGFESVFRLLTKLSKKVFILTDNDEWAGKLHGLKRIYNLLKIANPETDISIDDFSLSSYQEDSTPFSTLVKECSKYNIFIQESVGDSFEESLLNESLIDKTTKDVLVNSKLKNLSKNIEDISNGISEESVLKSPYLFKWVKGLGDE